MPQSADLFKQRLQDRVISLFHYMLYPDKYLFLGPSENVSRQPTLFVPVDKSQRIFSAAALSDNEEFGVPAEHARIVATAALACAPAAYGGAKPQIRG